MIKNLAFVFILGGIFLATIYYIANIINNPALAAILGALPFTLLSCFVIKDSKILKSYCKHMCVIMMITFSTLLLLIFLINNYNFNTVYLIMGILILWTIMMYIKIKYYD